MLIARPYATPVAYISGVLGITIQDPKGIRSDHFNLS
jgi:hypothetical protein